MEIVSIPLGCHTQRYVFSVGEQILYIFDDDVEELVEHVFKFEIEKLQEFKHLMKIK